MIVVLTGGTGGAKFIDGLQRVVAPEDLTVVVNTGDDHEWWGLNISPDIDSITYVLAGALSPERGWGVRGDTFHCLQQMKALGEPAWFSVGDRDLAVHLLRTRLMREGQVLSQATRTIADQFGVRARIFPMSDDGIETRIVTPAGEISFQEYFVQRRFQDAVKSVRFAGAAEAKPAPGVIEAIASAEAVLIAPSNPITSIGPILAVPGIREALRQTRAPVLAVSPIVGNRAVSGPAAALMAAQGLQASVAGVAKLYQDFLNFLVVQESDSGYASELNSERLRVHAANILMRSSDEKAGVARAALSLALGEPVHASAEAR